MIGQTVSHYKILEKLGQGGMGEVYLAEDTNLGRKVAVKFLSAEMAADLEARKRFTHEARSQAMLSHTNIATFHEVVEEGTKVFIVMEYIEGQKLSELAKTEKLSLPEVLDLAIQVGEGLPPIFIFCVCRGRSPCLPVFVFVGTQYLVPK